MTDDPREPDPDTGPRRGVLVLSCPDRPGVVAAVASELAGRGANIVHADQHLDAAHDLFLTRIDVEFPTVAVAAATRAGMAGVAAELDMDWDLHLPGPPTPVAILVSRQGHCLLDLLARVRLGELPARIALVVSNHPDHAEAVEEHGAAFLHLPVDPDDPGAQEPLVREAVRDSGAEVIVLARYMRILSEAFVDEHPYRIINVHHSFLPAFAGARAYHQAYERGVKLIGATAHYATVDLDAGPIIAQDVTRVTHRDDVERFVQAGRDLERQVLARALRLHLEHRVLVYANRTVVFD